MKDDKKYTAPKYHTSTQDLVTQYEECTNPVTKSSIRSIIAKRIDIHTTAELVKKSRNVSIRSYLDKCTFSFDGRHRMEKLFDLWFMQ